MALLWLVLRQSDEDEHNEVCEVCDTGGHVICCETCNLVYHTHCLKPPLAVVPAAAWYCPVCTLEVSPHVYRCRRRSTPLTRAHVRVCVCMCVCVCVCVCVWLCGRRV